MTDTPGCDPAPRSRPVPRGEMWIHRDAESLARHTARSIAEVARAAVADHGRFTFVLSGGTTPSRTYEELAALPVDIGVPWHATEVFFGDERLVAPGDPESNFRLASEKLLSRVPIAADHVHRIEGERSAHLAAERYEDTLRRVLALGDEGVPRFDLVLLGLASDGHTASLFAGTEALRKEECLVHAPWIVKLAGRRITMTPLAFNSAARVWFLVTGGSKAAVLTEAVTRSRSTKMPVHAIEPTDGELRWIVDAAAAVR